MEIHFAVLMHEYGSTGFCARNEAELYRQLAEWVREYANKETLRIELDKELVNEYFEFEGQDRGETLFVHCEEM